MPPETEYPINDNIIQTGIKKEEIFGNEKELFFLLCILFHIVCSLFHTINGRGKSICGIRESVFNFYGQFLFLCERRYWMTLGESLE